MLALRASAPIFSAGEVERLVLEHFGFAATVAPLAGERDANFKLSLADGRAFVAKVMPPVFGSEAQLAALRHLAIADPMLPVPRLTPSPSGEEVVRFERDGQFFYLAVLGFLPGEPPREGELRPTTLEAIGASLGRVDQGLQGFFHPNLGHPLAWDLRRLGELVRSTGMSVGGPAHELVMGAVAALDARAESLAKMRSQAIHGDGHGGNLLLDRDSGAVSGILDFGDMIHAPVIMELAVIMAEFLAEGLALPEDLASLVQGFGRVQALRAAEVEALFDLVRARLALTVTLHAWRSLHDAAGAALLDRIAAGSLAMLREFQERGPMALTSDWHAAAGTIAPGLAGGVAQHVDLERRWQLLGRGAELFYRTPLQFERGEDVWLFDEQGKAHLDVYNNVPHVGHCHPRVVRAVQRQIATLATHTRYLHPAILEYAEELTALCPPQLDTCIFVNSGSEANDVAWRLARFATGQTGALVMDHAYHGITDATAALTPSTGQPLDPRVGTLSIPSGDVDADRADAARAVEALAARGLKPAVFFLDTALTSSGIYDPPPAWGAGVTTRLREAGALIVADEVQYGLGRSGTHFWGFERRGFVPDIVTLGKPIANGYPMGAVIASRALVEAFQARHGFFSTFGGNAVAAAAARATLDVIRREHLQGNAEATGDYLKRKLTRLAARHGSLGEVRGKGLLLGLEVNGTDVAVARARTLFIINALASKARILIGYEGPQATLLKLRPPLTFRREHANLLVQAIDAAAAEVAAAEAATL